MENERAGGAADFGRSRETLESAGSGDSDTALALALQQHSEFALAEVYRRHGRAVIGFARTRTGNASEADDVAQEVFLALWRDPDRFEPSRGSLRTYLLTLASRRSIDTYRSEQARIRRQDRFHGGVDVGPSLEDSVAASDDAEFVRRSLDTLPADERVAIDLAYFGQHNYREVARLLGKPEGTIKSRIRSGLRRLRCVPDLALVLAS